MADPTPAELRVLLLALTARDAAAARTLLAAAGLDCCPCPTLDALAAEVAAGAGAVVLPQEPLLAGGGRLAAALHDQPAWSSVPVLVLTPPGPDTQRAAAARQAVGPMTLVPRPVQTQAFVSAVVAAVRDRRRQYAARAVLAERDRQAAELRAADRRKDEFLATLAHELRNPLAPLRTGLAILRQPAAGADQAAATLAMMDRQLAHLVRLVDDLLDVSRVGRGVIDLRRERVTVRAVVEAAVEGTRPTVAAAGHALTVSLPDDPLWLDADPVRLAQVVGNLLTNAAKYTPDGGRIALTVAQMDGAAVVRVADTGLGIPADMLPRVFDLFTQVGDHLQRSQGGLGIGLALVRQLVGLHGGSITADSPGPGRGSTFTVYLPLASVESASASARGEAAGSGCASHAHSSQRVLVVDDNEDAAESLGLLLRLGGRPVRVAHSGPAALRAAAEFAPAVVILDIGLPGLSGYEVARALRADPARAGLTLVALTGWGSEDDRRKSREAGFDHHLTKPVDAAALAAVLGG